VAGATLPEPAEFVSHVRAHAAGAGDRLALVALDESGAETASISYRHLDLRARAIARFLQERTEPGDRVILAFHDQVECASALIGCAYAGVIGVPLAVPASGKHDKGRFARIAGVIADCTPAFALSSARVAETIWPHALSNGISLACMPVDDVEEAAETDAPTRVPEPGDLFYLQYTSGSTGAPRGVRVSHGNVVSNILGLRAVAKFDPSAPFVSWLPHYHDMGLVVTMLYPMYFGNVTYLMSPATFLKRPLRWLEAISRYGAGSTAAPNFAYDLCVRRIPPAAFASLDLSSLTTAIVGAEPIAEATLSRFSKTFAPVGFSRSAWAPGYGLAESTVFVTGHRSERGYRMLETTSGARAVSCGRTSPDTTLRIVDPQSREPVEAGTAGEIMVAGPSVARGYWGKASGLVPVAESDGSVSEYLSTGDIGALVDGELCILGRLKDVVIINGTNHHAADLELTIAGGVADGVPGGCAVFGADVDGVERLVAAIEVERLRPELHAAMLGVVRRVVAERHDITVFDLVLLRPGRLPRTTSGKIRRYACRERYAVGELR